ncbi:hypothetical protein ZWY2020_048658 [Hordeum vulgare]|nr:hypothetical protein ZWY2020_048658 [Hordeum vulgare]
MAGTGPPRVLFAESLVRRTIQTQHPVSVYPNRVLDERHPKPYPPAMVIAVEGSFVHQDEGEDGDHPMPYLRLGRVYSSTAPPASKKPRSSPHLGGKTP